METRVLVFVLLVAFTCNADFGYLKKNLAMKKNAGLYISEQIGGADSTITFNLEKDGGCKADLILFDINPVNANFTLAITYATCQWEVIDFNEDNDPIAKIFFFQYALDPASELFINGTCVDGCLVFGFQVGVLKNDRYTYNEITTWTDFNFNPIDAPLIGGSALESSNNVIKRFREEDAESIIETLGKQVPGPPDC